MQSLQESNPKQVSPKVSVLLPVYNAERFVAETISSVLNQTYRDFELLIIDDGSTDQSLAVIQASAANDSRVCIKPQSNAGFAKTLNRLVDQAQGKYLARIDADDLAEPDRFARQVRFLDEMPSCVLVGSAITQIDQDGDPYAVVRYPTEPEKIKQSLLSGVCCITHPAVMLRRAAVDNAGGYALDFPVVEDQELWLRLSLIGDLCNLEQPLTRYRIHADNMSFRELSKAVEAYNRMMRDAYRSRGLEGHPPQNEASEQAIPAWDRQRQWAWTAIQEGNISTARKHARRLIRGHVGSADCWKLFAFAHFAGPAAFFRKLIRS